MNPEKWKVIRRPAAGDGELEGYDLLFGSIRQVQADLAPFLSVEGVFIPTGKPLPHSSVLRFRVMLPDEFALIEGTGVVFWLRKPGESGKLPAGMAVNFVTLGERSRELIEKIVETHLEAGGHPFDVHSKTGDDEPEEPPKVVKAPPADVKKKVTLGMGQVAQESGNVGVSFSVRGETASKPPTAPVSPAIPSPFDELDPNATVWAPPKPSAPVATRAAVGSPAALEPPSPELPPVEAPVEKNVVDEAPALFEAASAAPTSDQGEQLELELDSPIDNGVEELELSMDLEAAHEVLPEIDEAPEQFSLPDSDTLYTDTFNTEEPVAGSSEVTEEIPLDMPGDDADASMAEDPGFWVEADGAVTAETSGPEGSGISEFQPNTPVEAEPEVLSPEDLGTASFGELDEIEPPSWGQPEDSEELQMQSPQEVVEPDADHQEMFEIPEPTSVPESSVPETMSSIEPEPQAQGQQFVFKLPESVRQPEAEPESDAAEPVKTTAMKKKRSGHSNAKVKPIKKAPLGWIAVFVILVAALGAGGYFGWQWYQSQMPSDQDEVVVNEEITENVDSEPVSDPGEDQDGVEGISDADAEAISVDDVDAGAADAVPVDVEPTQVPVVITESARQVATGPARVVHGITWEQSLSGTDVVISCDAEFIESQLSVFPMDDPARILVRLRKIETGYRDEVIEIGTEELQRIRIGFHPEQSPPALYVVLDVVDAAVVVLDTDIDGDVLRIKLGR